MILSASAAAALLLVATPAPAPGATKASKSVRECNRDPNLGHCLSAEQRQLTQRYAVPEIEQYRAAGEQVLRVFFIDGYDRHLAALEFVRPKGGDPLLRVHFPPQNGKARPPPLTAPIDGPRWWSLVSRSRFFDRALVPLPKRKLPDNVIVICGHPWRYFAEASDPADVFADELPPVRRRTSTDCDPDLVGAFGDEAEAVAVELLPACTALDRELHDSGIALLVACGKLRGDRLAAAQVMDAADPFLNGRDEEGPLWTIFASGAAISWAGQARGGEEPATFWAAKAKEAGDLTFAVDEVLGETRERVLLRGTLRRFSRESERHEAAPVEQIWTLETGDYRVERAVVGAFVPVPRR